MSTPMRRTRHPVRSRERRGQRRQRCAPNEPDELAPFQSIKLHS
jgi:hypothetical protein